MNNLFRRSSRLSGPAGPGETTRPAAIRKKRPDTNDWEEVPPAVPLKTVKAEEYPHFDGSTPDDVLRFIQTIQRISIINDFHDNDDTIVSYVSRCLQGPAAQWYRDLSGSTTRKWSELRLAMITHFLNSNPRRGPPQQMKGTIMVLDAEDGRIHGYVSKIPTANLCQEPAEALELGVLESGPTDDPYYLKMLNYEFDEKSKPYSFLGLLKCDSYWVLQPCNRGMSGDLFKRRSIARADFDGLASSAVWTILPASEDDDDLHEITVEWTSNSGLPMGLDIYTYFIRDSSVSLPLSDAYSALNSFDTSGDNRTEGSNRSLVPGGYLKNTYGGYRWSTTVNTAGANDKGKGLFICRSGQEPTNSFRNARRVRFILQ